MTIKSPSHYGDTSLMDYLISHKIGFAEGNICKYVVRWEQKDGIKDLIKARTYLDALIASAELNTVKQSLDLSPSLSGGNWPLFPEDK